MSTMTTIGTREEIDTRLHTVWMLVDLATAEPVAGPYLDLEANRDAWQFLQTAGTTLSTLELVVRDRADLVEQVRRWSVDRLHQRQADRSLPRAGRCGGCP